jgi:hypothetical protein
VNCIGWAVSPCTPTFVSGGDQSADGLKLIDLKHLLLTLGMNKYRFHGNYFFNRAAASNTNYSSSAQERS